MRYTATRKQETRAKMLAAGRAVAKRGGFEFMGVDTLMASIGLTGGAFYSHYRSKQAFFVELVRLELENSAQMLSGEADSSADQVVRHLRSYLSSAHAANPETGCALPTLGPEIARADPEVRRSAEKSLKRTQQHWSKRLEDSDAAWALIAQCVGALVIARSVAGEKTRKEILAACRRDISRTRGLDLDR